MWCFEILNIVAILLLVVISTTLYIKQLKRSKTLLGLELDFSRIKISTLVFASGLKHPPFLVCVMHQSCKLAPSFTSRFRQLLTVQIFSRTGHITVINQEAG